MNQDNKTTIEAVIKTLEAIFENRGIAGRQNADMMLGCIVTLERLLKEDTAE